MKQLKPFPKFWMFYPPQNTQKVKHRTFTIGYTKSTFIGKMTHRVLILSCDINDSGYKLPFKDSMPTKCFLRNNRSALNNPEFVESSILQLLKNGKIEEHSSASFCDNLLSVVESKKKRLNFDEKT